MVMGIMEKRSLLKRTASLLERREVTQSIIYKWLLRKILRPPYQHYFVTWGLYHLLF